MLTREQKAAIASDYRVHETDTGSSELQVAMLTARIARLTEHLREHRHDFSTRRALMKLVGRRRRQLTYLNHTDVTRYQTLITRLGLRR